MDQAEVRQAQERLQAFGFYEGPIDGRYGPETAEALREYQRAQGLTITGTLTAGVLGAALWSQLRGTFK